MSPIEPTMSPGGTGMSPIEPTMSPGGTGMSPIEPTTCPGGTGMRPMRPLSFFFSRDFRQMSAANPGFWVSPSCAVCARLAEVGTFSFPAHG
mmetsp:Transcript_109598/g.251352  ORF Transcript_109598/g.251352 Transcript_109598/m.251352 type:complete len:92 (-) Transcript_109598:15-290(-)